MHRTKFRREPYFRDGSLGCIEGLTILSDSPAKQALCRYFGGVPYALPPLGTYRFRRPRALPECYRYGTSVNNGRFSGTAAYCPQPRFMSELTSAPWEEDCLQLNIYIPTEDPPSDGWPVFFYIHGGFLQFGTPNMSPEAIAPLLSETAFRGVIVMAGYRLNILGFLASKELQDEAERYGESCGNMGFWDQRKALEWTSKNIAFFGGNPDNIVIGGYSAGAHSAFHQLAHELYFVPDDKALIKRVIMWSNSPGVQPRTVSQQQAQFDELLDALNISRYVSVEEKLQRLRSTPIKDLVDVQDHLRLSEFRATSDNAFVSQTLMTHINDGDFARRMKRRSIKLMNGECRDEHNVYQIWRTPSQSFDAVRCRLIADYPETIVNRLMHHYCGEDKTLPSDVKDWQDLFGRIYANMQVHHLERGFYRALESGGLEFGQDVLRYRINWRAKCVDEGYPPEWGVTHGTDLAIWMWGLDSGDGLLDHEKELLKPWNKAFASFVRGEDSHWGTGNVREMKRLRADGKTDVWIDDQWEEGLRVWDIINGSKNDSIVSPRPKL